ncbi:hypothetical protein K0U07_05700 [bacterium]|nr:hypothetical protein [bacterium]
MNPHEIMSYFFDAEEGTWIELVARLNKTYTTSIADADKILNILTDDLRQSKIEIAVSKQMLALGYITATDINEKSYIEITCSDSTN